MSTNKSIDKICIIIAAAALVISVLFCGGEAFGIEAAARVIGYENRIFDGSRVHTIDIVMDGWEEFIDTCQSEEYSSCAVVIDGEAYKNVGIRGKGNTSLSSVSSMGSERYSFKIEFDHYDDSLSYHGLDKLCLNNIIQDNTFMKDYLSYTLMKDFGVDAPLCSYAYITVNGEDWGLYLAVEGIEESFLQRNYGSGFGELYKPDSMSFGGGRGNGAEFDMEGFMNKNVFSDGDEGESENQSADGGFSPRGVPEGSVPNFEEDSAQGVPEGFSPPEISETNGRKQGFGGMSNGKAGGMGSSDVKLQYIDDNVESYSNIFDNAKTDVSDTDKKRLINALKKLSLQEDIESTVNTDEVIRYFVVHNFLCNGDSYTGSMIHNYYLYENDGRLSMIPWDYNLAFGTFQADSSSSVNDPIDTPVSGDMSDRPMISWIFDIEEYTEKYHELFGEFIADTDFCGLISDTADMIREYVEKDPTKFCTYDEFEKGVTAIQDFCTLRAESVSGQLEGTIPSTTDGQREDGAALVDTSSLDISDMGTMNGGMGRGMQDKFAFSADYGGEMSGGFAPPDNIGGGTSGDFAPPDGFGSEAPGGSGGNTLDSSGENTTDGLGGNALDRHNGSSDMSGQNSDRPFPEDFSSAAGDASEDGKGALILLGASLGVLIIGLAIAFWFKRR